MVEFHSLHLIHSGDSVHMGAPALGIDVEGANYNECYNQFKLSVIAALNEYRERHGGITPEMLMIEEELEEMKDGYVKELHDGTWAINQQGFWL